jgi:uncharacterized membrane protein YfcA
MDTFLIAILALLASLLTFFSGFGLGTLMLPVFCIIYPVEIAVLMTALVHFLNNCFKFLLVFKYIQKNFALRFAFFSIPAAVLGSYMLSEWIKDKILFNYQIQGISFDVTFLKIFIGCLMLLFVIIETNSTIKSKQISPKYLPVGAVLSGFFGGLSGHQGALRSMFLIKSIPSKKKFIATGIAIACLVDLTRIPLYIWYLRDEHLHTNNLQLIIVALAAFVGAYFGNKFLHKIEISSIHKVVTFFLIFTAAMLISGLI